MIARVRRLAAQHQDDFSKRVLAFAEINYGTPASADPPLRALLSNPGNDAELPYLMGLRHLMAGRLLEGEARATAYQEALRWLARAHRIAPDHYPTLLRYAEALSEGADYGSQNMRDILLNALDLAPQVGTVRLAAAHVLAFRGETDLAREILEPMVRSTHNPAAHQAADLLGQLQRGERPTRQHFAQILSVR